MIRPDKMEALQRLGGGLSHELNNLFTAISGNLQLIEHQSPSRDEILEILGDVQRAAARGLALARKLRMFSGQQDLYPEQFDLGEMVRGIAKLSILDDVKIVLQLPPEPCPVFIDRSELRTVLTEIVSNARTAMSPGGTLTFAVRPLPPTAQTDGRRAGGVLLTISDTGHGMTPEIQEKAFDPMFTTKPRARPDVGWGLSLAAALLGQSGGALTLIPLREGGTCAAIALPQQPKQVASRAHDFGHIKERS